MVRNTLAVLIPVLAVLLAAFYIITLGTIDQQAEQEHEVDDGEKTEGGRRDAPAEG